MPCSRRACVFAVLVLVTCTPALLSDEALLKDGRSVQGKLSQSESGTLKFIGNAEVALADIERVRLPVNVPPFRAGVLHHVTLNNAQHLCGEIVALDAQTLRLRTAWNDRLMIPRRLLVSVAHLTGLITVVDDDFETGLKTWQLTGTPTLSDGQQTSGQKSLRLHSAGQAAEFVLPKPIDAGGLGINFHLPANIVGLRWSLEAEFQPATAKREMAPLKVIVADEGDDYVVETPVAAEEGDKIRRTPGWHRLAMRFHESYVLVGIDDRVLFAGKQGPGGALTKLRLRCEAAGTAAAKPRGDVCFDDLSVARRVPSRMHPGSDGKQDELWLLDGDQLFGSIVKADRRSIDVHGRFGERRFPWSEVRAIYFRRPHPPQEEAPHAEREAYHVRVTFHSGCGEQLDELEGSVAAFDEQRLTLRHADLGKLDIERARIWQIRPLR